MFDFGAGDADTGFAMGEPWPSFGWTDISQYDDPVALNQQITIPHGPERLWVQTIALEDDRTIWTGGITFGRRPTFTEAGFTYQANAAAQQASATEVLEIENTPGKRTTNFELRTGDFPVDFVMSCRLVVDVKLGAVIRPFRLQPPIGGMATVLSEPGSISGLITPGPSERTEVVALGADGALLHRSIAQELPERRDDNGDWTRIELPGRGKTSVVASGPDMLDLVFLDSEGRVSHRSYNPREPRTVKWRSLGGRFREISAAYSPSNKKKADGTVVFGVAEDGGVHVRELRDRGQDWRRVGDHAVRAVTPVSIPGQGAALFAVGDDRTLHYFVKRDGRWVSRTAPVPLPGRVPTQSLSATFHLPQARKGQRAQAELVLGAMGEDHLVRILRWPGFPAGAPRNWEELGPLQELLTPGADSRPARSRQRASAGSPKPRRGSRKKVSRRPAARRKRKR